MQIQAQNNRFKQLMFWWTVITVLLVVAHGTIGLTPGSTVLLELLPGGNVGHVIAP
jgi:hypothetical protein